MRRHERRPRPWVKICGVTRPEDVERAIDLGADLVGLNFWPRSPRHVDPAAAREIAALARGRATVVGVFVNEDPGRIGERIGELNLDLVQLHGDEPATVLAAFAPRRIHVLRADELDTKHSAGIEGLSLQQKVFAPAGEAKEELPDLILIDSPRDARRYGGTGEAWAWAAAREWIARCPRPVLVAGGLRPDNAAAALAATGATGVDVASGVESAPGIKDAEKMRALIEGVRGVAT